MLIKKLRLENIRSYNTQEIEFPNGSVLLSGDIGSGKTSILMAIEFALFGLQPTQRGSALLKSGKNYGRVILELDIEGKTIILERTLKKSGKNINQDYASLSVDNEKFEESVTEIKNKVLNLLNYPSEFAKKTNLLYKFTVYTPQEEMKQIILESADIRLNTLRHVFGIDKYKRIEENINIFTAKLREQIRTKEGQLADTDKLRANLEEKENKLIILKQTKEKENKILEEKIQIRKLAEEEARKIEGKIKEKENLEKEKDKSNIMLANKKDSFLDLRAQTDKLNKELVEGRKLSFDEKRFQEILQAITSNKKLEKSYQERIIDFSSKLASLSERRKETQELYEKISKLQTCPTCLQEVNAQYKENIFQKINSEISVIAKEAEEITKKKTKYSESLKTLQQQIINLEQKKSEQEINKIKLENLKEKQASLAELEKRKKQIDSDIQMMLKHISSLEESIDSFSKYIPLFEEKQKNLEEQKSREKQQEIKIAEINKEIDLIMQVMGEIKKQIQEKQELKKKLTHLKSLEDWMDDKLLNMILFTEKNVMLKLRDEFSKLFSEWFSVLVSDSLSVRLDEQFTPVIEQQGFELAYSHLSGGERTAIALAYRLALNQVINSLLSRIKTRDLVILDEPTDGFSETQLDKMRDVLQQLNIGQLILVSHEAKIESFVDNIIKFRKEAGITRVER